MGYPMNPRFALGVQYDGRDWQGWQSQPHGRTVQDVLEAALLSFTGAPVRITAAGRTDTGVHALGQVVHFETPASRPAHAWVRGLNSLLPDSVAIDWALPVASDFHARFSARARVYQYVLYLSPVRSAHLVGRTGWVYHDLDLARMQAAARHAEGEHDFSALRSAQCQARSPIKVLHGVRLEQQGPFVVVSLRADAFLHHMVRNLMGCLLVVGRGQRPPEWLSEVLASRDRSKAAPTFMADGLYLAGVEYPETFAIPGAAALDTVFPGLGARP